MKKCNRLAQRTGTNGELTKTYERIERLRHPTRRALGETLHSVKGYRQPLYSVFNKNVAFEYLRAGVGNERPGTSLFPVEIMEQVKQRETKEREETYEEIADMIIAAFQSMCAESPKKSADREEEQLAEVTFA